LTGQHRIQVSGVGAQLRQQPSGHGRRILKIRADHHDDANLLQSKIQALVKGEIGPWLQEFPGPWTRGSPGPHGTDHDSAAILAGIVKNQPSHNRGAIHKTGLELDQLFQPTRLERPPILRIIESGSHHSNSDSGTSSDANDMTDALGQAEDNAK
jgi:hypothetical protein